MNFGQSLVQIMSAMSAIDGNTDEKEVAVLLEISKKLGVSGEDFAEGITADLGEAVIWIKENINQEGRTMALATLAIMALADGEEHENEKVLFEACTEAWA